jgi:hypothetical protein
VTARLSSVWARLPASSLGRLALIVALTLVVDVTASAAVWVDRRDDPAAPTFRTAAPATIDWDAEVYPGAPPVLGFTPVLPSSAHRDAQGRIRVGSAPADPDTILRYVLGCLDKYDGQRDPRWLRAASSALDDLLQRSPSGFLAHPNQVIDVLGRTIEPPWYAASTQGLALSALSRMYELTGNTHWRRPAAGVFATLYAFRGFFNGSLPAPLHWMASVDTEGYLWFDRFSEGLDTVAVLTEQLTTAFGVYDYQRALARTPEDRHAARTLFEGTLATLTKYLPRYRVPGQISVSSLAAGNRNIREHLVATAELAMLARLSGSSTLARYSRLFDRDDAVPYFVVHPVTATPGVDAYSPIPPELALRPGQTAPLAVTPVGLPTAGPGATDPTQDAGFALAALDRYRTGGDKVWLQRAESAVNQAMATARDGFLTYKTARKDAFGQPLPRPWHSAEGQALVLSALTRLYAETGQQKWRDQADQVFRALTTVRDYGYPGPRPWSAFLDFSGYLWFEQYPEGSQPSQLLRGHVDAVVALYDYWSMTKSSTAYSYFRGGLASLHDALPTYIRTPGTYARSSLATDAHDPRQHLYLTGQVATLASITGDRVLARNAHLMAADYAKARGAERCQADPRCRELLRQ